MIYLNFEKTQKYIFRHQFPKSGKIYTFLKTMSSKSSFIRTDKNITRVFKIDSGDI
jgi:hypothetical protein